MSIRTTLRKSDIIKIWNTLIISFLFLSALDSQALFVRPSYIPVNRLISNTEAFLNKNPNNADAHYTLARIHYLAFVNKANKVGIINDSTPPTVAPDWLLGNFLLYSRDEHAQQLVLAEYGYQTVENVPEEKRPEFWKSIDLKSAQLKAENWQPSKIPEEIVISHAHKAVKSFQNAIKHDDGNGLYFLGLASLYEQYLGISAQADRSKHPSTLAKITRAMAKDAYLKAYHLSIKKDLKLRRKPTAGLPSLVGHEAGKAYIRLINEEGNISKEEKKTIQRIERNLKKLVNLRRGPITPIVFSLKEHSSFNDLLSHDVNVTFDLDGNGHSELWPWVKPSTGILVWDPERKKDITSGRQLFGSVTWWIFFHDGYAALDALDDNRDGMLRHAEMDGIAVWFDANSNGTSEPDEVTEIKEIGVTGISTRSKYSPGGILFSSTGIELVNGQVIRTYDWVTQAIQKSN